jgi:hypothetical protein
MCHRCSCRQSCEPLSCADLEGEWRELCARRNATWQKILAIRPANAECTRTLPWVSLWAGMPDTMPRARLSRQQRPTGASTLRGPESEETRYFQLGCLVVQCSRGRRGRGEKASCGGLWDGEPERVPPGCPEHSLDSATFGR